VRGKCVVLCCVAILNRRIPNSEQIQHTTLTLTDLCYFCSQCKLAHLESRVTTFRYVVLKLDTKANMGKKKCFFGQCDFNMTAFEVNLRLFVDKMYP
jgi:hypothetical protein